MEFKNQVPVQVSDLVGYTLTGWSYVILKEFEKFFDRRDRGLLTFIVEGQKIKSHSRIYCASATFGREFVRDFCDEVEIEVDFCNAEEFMIILEILYGRYVTREAHKAPRIRYLLEKFGVECYEAFITSGSEGTRFSLKL